MKRNEPVIYYREDGREVRTKTTCDSYMLYGKEVIHLLGHKQPIPVSVVFEVPIKPQYQRSFRMSNHEAH